MTTENSVQSNPKEDQESNSSATSKSSKSPKSSSSKDVKTSKHATRYLIIGIGITIFNFSLYSIIAMIINNNNFLWLSTFIATAVTTIVAYILHSKITWKERNVTKSSIYKFFIWNAFLTIAINPGLTQLFSLITPLYNFGFSITQSINLPLTYEQVQSTGAFVLTAIITTILNFLFYDRFVFGKKPNM